MRVVGQLLELLSSEESKNIFTVMTSNDVAALPPELTRSGRLDTTWYFGLPTEEERKEIFNIHFAIKDKNVSDKVLEEAAKITSNYTGAEIKEIVKTAIRKAFMRMQEDGNKDITIDDIRKATVEVVAVSIAYKEKIAQLESYAETRARFASKKDSNNTTKQESISLFNR